MGEMPYKDKDAQKQAQHQSYLRNKAKVLQRGYTRRNEFRAWFDSLKTDPCLDCGGRFPTYVMQWDHRPGVDKFVRVGVLRDTLNREAVLVEIAKCDLVCANCHAIRTHDRDQYFGRNKTSPSIPTAEKQR